MNINSLLISSREAMPAHPLPPPIMFSIWKQPALSINTHQLLPTWGFILPVHQARALRVLARHKQRENTSTWRLMCWPVVWLERGVPRPTDLTGGRADCGPVPTWVRASKGLLLYSSLGGTLKVVTRVCLCVMRVFSFWNVFYFIFNFEIFFF